MVVFTHSPTHTQICQARRLAPHPYNAIRRAIALPPPTANGNARKRAAMTRECAIALATPPQPAHTPTGGVVRQLRQPYEEAFGHAATPT